jgi:hypothetical protein
VEALVKNSIRVAAVLVVLAWVMPATAAPHPEISIFPIGPAPLPSGVHEEIYRLPARPDGVVLQPVVFLASQPLMPVTTSAPVLPAPSEDPGKQKKEPVDCTVVFTIGGKSLPPWVLKPHATAYVINVATVKANPEFPSGRLAVKVDIQTKSVDLEMSMLGMPDPTLLDDSTNGPLELFVEKAQGDAKKYLEALYHEIGGDKAGAAKVYEGLTASSDARVGRMARRSLRLANYELRPFRLSGNFMEHYRWGLYFQAAGFFGPAFKEYDECRIIDPAFEDTQYRAGIMRARNEGNIMAVLDYMERTGEAAGNTRPSYWYPLVVIQKDREGKQLTAADIARIKDNWLVMEYYIWAASGGNIYTQSCFHQVTEEDQPYKEYAPGVFGPTEEIIHRRGWFDAVFSVRPRLSGEVNPPTRTIGGDRGPNGAALSTFFSDADWNDFYSAWYEQFTWALTQGEAQCGWPEESMVSACGMWSAPNPVAAHCEAVRHFVTRGAARAVKIVDEPVPGSCLTLWQVEGPFAASRKGAGGGPAEPLAGEAKETKLVSSNGDFVDLKKVMPNAGAARARATCWVYSPDARNVRMWLGQNDAAAVWLNCRCVHRGELAASGNYRDRNIVDTVACAARLEEGWNEVQVVVESLPTPDDKGWGFSLRFCDWENRALVGLASVNTRPSEGLVEKYSPPQVGEYYAWAKVREAYDSMLPRLTDADLQKITGIAGLSISGRIAGLDGWVAFDAPSLKGSHNYRAAPAADSADCPADVVVNNLLDWQREACAALRYQRDGKTRDLLLVRPEAMDAYLTLLDEPASASGQFGGSPVGDRVLGYASTPAGGSHIDFFVIDCLLTDGKPWPTDEEDLLNPIGKVRVPNRELPTPETGPTPPKPS